jgi:hypothetical protein
VLRTRIVCLTLAWSAWLGCSLAAPVARADAARAEQLFNAGVEDMLAGRFEQGCSRIAHSQQEDPKPGTVFTLAECYARWGKTASAATQYTAYLDLVKALPAQQQAAHDERVAVARAEYDKLSPDIPELVLVWPGAPPRDATVTLDGVEINQETLGRARHVDPGEHRVAVNYADGSQSSRRVSIALGQSLRVILPTPRGNPGTDPPIDVPPDTQPAKPGSSQRTWAYIVGAVGATSLLVGAGSGIFVFQQKRIIDNNCEPVSPDVQVCNGKGKSAEQDARIAGVVSTVGFAVGAAAMGVAIPLLLTAPSASSNGKREPRWHVGIAPTGGGAAWSLRASF